MTSAVKVIFELGVSWQFGSGEKESGLESYSSGILFQPLKTPNPKLHFLLWMIYFFFFSWTVISGSSA